MKKQNYLTKQEIELLTDYIVEASNDPRVNCALRLLLHDIDILSIERPMEIESICVFAKDRAYNRLTNLYLKFRKGGQDGLIKRLRREFKWKGRL